MITNKHTQGFIVGVLSTIVFVLLVASNTLQSDPNLERRVTSLEERVAKLEQSNSMDVGSGPSESRQANNWRRLENGMSMSQVRSLLGEPDRVMTMSQLVTWEIGRGTVSFYQGKVDGWVEPMSY